MKAFASLATLAVSVSAIDSKYVAEAAVEVVDVQESYYETFNVLEDAEIAVAMKQGTGRDHTDWSWKFEKEEAKDVVIETKEDVEAAELGLILAEEEYADVLALTLSPQLEHQRNCQLHREEEINLYYQCTQNDINNYALNHFGGEKRSYPRWVEEYNVCIDHIHSAKTLHLDYYWPDGTVTLEPCDPQNHSSSVYIEQFNTMPVVGGMITVISAEPLNPYVPCHTQHIPNWGGIWVEVADFNEAQSILMGNTVLDKSYTQRCYSIQPTARADQALLVETWEEGEKRTYDVELKADNRFGYDGCAVHTHLHGSHFNQWISGVQGFEVSMNRQISEEWYTVSASGEEKFYSQHNEVRVGDCAMDAEEKYTLTKHYTPGVRVVY